MKSEKNISKGRLAYLNDKERSQLMGKIKSKNTKPELIIRKYLHNLGFRYRLHDKQLPGKPDMVFPKYRTVIFIQGCFWHFHSSNCSIKPKIPQLNVEVWTEKLARNVKRDYQHQENLRALGWKVLVVWECQLKASIRIKTMEEIVKILKSYRNK